MIYTAGLRGGVVVSAVASLQEGRSPPGAFLCGLCMSSYSPKTVLTGDCERGCLSYLSLCGAVMDLW